jgi:hypothetical protein
VGYLEGQLEGGIVLARLHRYDGLPGDLDLVRELLLGQTEPRPELLYAVLRMLTCISGCRMSRYRPPWL